MTRARRAPWKWAGFRTDTPAGPLLRYGSVWHVWGIFYHRTDRGFHVCFIPSGRRLTSFELLRHARRWCEAIDGLADWSAENPFARGVSLRMHQLALQVTGARPDLRVIDDNEGAP
jgi:hypothetical protein